MTSIQSITTKVAHPTEASGNILFRLQALVCRINAQLSRLSQETQSRSQTMKKEYRVATDKSASLTKSIGLFTPCISGAALIVGFAANYQCGANPTTPFDKLLVGSPDLVHGCGKFLSSFYEAEIGQQNSISGLRQTEISNESQKSGEARDLQSELQQLLANIRELFKRAAS